VHVSPDVPHDTSRGDQPVVAAEVGSSGFNGPSHFTFELEGGRVARMAIRA
jgi:hypothetical protein